MVFIILIIFFYFLNIKEESNSSSFSFKLFSNYHLYFQLHQHLTRHSIYIYIYIREVPLTSQLLSHFSLNTRHSMYQRNFSSFLRSSYFSSTVFSSYIYIYTYALEKFLSITSSLEPNTTLYRTPYTYMNQRNFIFFGLFLESTGRWSLSSLPDKLEQAFYALRG